MSGIKITDLPAAASALLTDVYPIDQLPGPVTYKESNQQLLTLFQANGTALTKTDDTNVTMTLGGSPTIALLNATSMTLGWTGQLSVPRGGTGNSTFTAYSVICGGTTATGAFQNVSGVGTANQVLVSNGAGALPTWQSVPGLTPAALTKTDDTNVTLTLGGTPATALLQATSITAGWTGTLSGTRGGTGVNNGASTITLGGSLTTSGAFASTFTMTGVTGVTFPTSGTLATTSQIPTGAALTKVDDTNVTLTLGGTPTTALINAASITAGWTGTLSGTRGGTGTNNGASTITLGGSLTTSGAFASTFTMTNTTTVTFPTSGTLATTAQIPTGAALTKTDDTNVTLTLGGSPTTALVNAASIAAGWTGQLALTRGGTNASLTASNGGIFYSTASAGAILAGTATANQLLLSGASTTPAWSTTTYPATNAVSTLLYASSANVMSALATANSAVLVTNSSGVPAWSGTMTNGQLIIGNTSGTPTAATLSAGSGITITNGAGTITIASSTSGMTWTTVSGTSQAAAINNGYITNNAGAVTVSLPTTFAIGDAVEVKGLGAGGWVLAAGTATTIRMGSSVTSSAGSLTSANQYDTVKVTGLVANTTWSVDYAFSAGLTVA